MAVFHVWFLFMGISLSKRLQKNYNLNPDWTNWQRNSDSGCMDVWKGLLHRLCENGQNFKSKSSALKYKNGILLPLFFVYYNIFLNKIITNWFLTNYLFTVPHAVLRVFSEVLKFPIQFQSPTVIINGEPLIQIIHNLNCYNY